MMVKKRAVGKSAATSAGADGNVSAAQKIRDYRKEHPRAKIAAIAKALGLSYQHVYNVLKAKKAKSSGKKKSATAATIAATNGHVVENGIRAVELAYELLKVAGDGRHARAAVAAAEKLVQLQA